MGMFEPKKLVSKICICIFILIISRILQELFSKVILDSHSFLQLRWI